VISKSIQADLKKYKMGGASIKRDRTRSPLRNRSKERAPYAGDHHEEPLDVSSLGDLSKEVSHYLSQINSAT
jgi:hypothetical protein